MPQVKGDPTSLTAAQAAHLIQNGKLCPETLMAACLDHIAIRDPTATRPGSPQGIPIGARDMLDTADMPSQYGFPIWTHW